MPDQTPDSTPSELDTLLARWADDAQLADQRVAPHLDELTDHLRTAVLTRIEAGQELDAAFEDAARDFGEPAAVAAEYAKSSSRLARLLRWLSDEEHTTRVDVGLAASWIGFSLAWAASVVLADLSVNWMLVGWFATTFGPLTALDVSVRRRRARR